LKPSLNPPLALFPALILAATWLSAQGAALRSLPAGPDTAATGPFDSGTAPDGGGMDDMDLTMEEGLAGGTSSVQADAGFWRKWIGEPLRLTVNHEISEKVQSPVHIRNNRSSLRGEYAKYLLGNFFVQADYKLTAHLKRDHQAVAKGKSVALEHTLREAFLQASVYGTSLKLGYQILVWGESDGGGAITDEISPRNYSELFFVSQEESRIGQPMATLSQYTGWGEWSLVFVPFPAYNKMPGVGTAYWYDPFAGAPVRKAKRDAQDEFEYGARWKRALGRSDISLMGGSLMDNDPVFRFAGDTIREEKLRFSFAGAAFNYSLENLLVKGELAAKHPKAFMAASGRTLEKPVLDGSLGFEFSRGGTFSLGLEAVHNRVLRWDPAIQGVPEATNTLVLIASDRFLNENLSVNLLTRYSEPYTTVMNIGMASYRVSDNVTLELEGHFPYVDDERSSTWMYRDQKQAVFRWRLQL
jgi:hypothetical protein